MPIPTPEERPDLYDDYDGLPEGHVSSVTFTPSPQLEALKRPKSGQDTPAAPPPVPAAAPPAPPPPA